MNNTESTPDGREQNDIEQIEGQEDKPTVMVLLS